MRFSWIGDRIRDGGSKIGRLSRRIGDVRDERDDHTMIDKRRRYESIERRKIRNIQRIKESSVQMMRTIIFQLVSPKNRSKVLKIGFSRISRECLWVPEYVNS